MASSFARRERPPRLPTIAHRKAGARYGQESSFPTAPRSRASTSGPSRAGRSCSSRARPRSIAKGQVQGKNAAEQTTITMRKIEAGLKSAGARLADLTRTTIYVTDIRDMGAVIEALGKALKGSVVTSTLVAVTCPCRAGPAGRDRGDGRRRRVMRGVSGESDDRRECVCSGAGRRWSGRWVRSGRCWRRRRSPSSGSSPARSISSRSRSPSSAAAMSAAARCTTTARATASRSAAWASAASASPRWKPMATSTISRSCASFPAPTARRATARPTATRAAARCGWRITNGVMIDLKTRRQGLAVSLGADAVIIDFK